MLSITTQYQPSTQYQLTTQPSTTQPSTTHPSTTHPSTTLLQQQFITKRTTYGTFVIYCRRKQNLKTYSICTVYI